MSQRLGRRGVACQKTPHTPPPHPSTHAIKKRITYHAYPQETPQVRAHRTPPGTPLASSLCPPISIFVVRFFSMFPQAVKDTHSAECSLRRIEQGGRCKPDSLSTADRCRTSFWQNARTRTCSHPTAKSQSLSSVASSGGGNPKQSSSSRYTAMDLLHSEP